MLKYCSTFMMDISYYKTVWICIRSIFQTFPIKKFLINPEGRLSVNIKNSSRKFSACSAQDKDQLSDDQSPEFIGNFIGIMIEILKSWIKVENYLFHVNHIFFCYN